MQIGVKPDRAFIKSLLNEAKNITEHSDNAALNKSFDMYKSNNVSPRDVNKKDGNLDKKKAIIVKNRLNSMISMQSGNRSKIQSKNSATQDNSKERTIVCNKNFSIPVTRNQQSPCS